MADVKISALPAATAISLTDEFPANQAGTTRKITLDQLTGGLRRNLVFACSDFFSLIENSTAIVIGGDYSWSTKGSGASATLDFTSGPASHDHPGVARIVRPASGSDVGAVFGTSLAAMKLTGGEKFELIFQIPTTSPSDETLRLGFHDCNSVTDAANGAYIEVPTSTLAAVGKTAAASTRSTTGTSLTLSTATWYRARIEVNSNATQVDFYIYNDSGTQLWHDSLTTNIPTAALGARTIATSAAATGGNLLDVDYMANWHSAVRG